jgi:hypothetical protein
MPSLGAPPALPSLANLPRFLQGARFTTSSSRRPPPSSSRRHPRSQSHTSRSHCQGLWSLYPLQRQDPQPNPGAGPGKWHVLMVWRLLVDWELRPRHMSLAPTTQTPLSLLSPMVLERGALAHHHAMRGRLLASTVSRSLCCMLWSRSSRPSAWRHRLPFTLPGTRTLNQMPLLEQGAV